MLARDDDSDVSPLQTGVVIALTALAATSVWALLFAAWESGETASAGRPRVFGSFLLLPYATSLGGAALLAGFTLRRADPRARHCAELLGGMLLLAALSAVAWKLALGDS